MSNALAIAGVTAILRDRLNDGLLNANLDSLGQFSVTSSPPDLLVGDADPANRLNIYLWNVTRNAAWSSQRLPARSAAGERIDNPFLALDLHYILTATGAEDLNAEILLGYGMQVLHETPVLTRADIRTALGVPIRRWMPACCRRRCGCWSPPTWPISSSRSASARPCPKAATWARSRR